ncbi:LacI family DNA-binding transcriptional regulator [Anaerocolumna sp. MB42-C2]|uniref:LacI family DNA-binding transcriptional regulator n=1 Tax=Anaerocolumna sp. MB42-C2 TaxID=3070997 RepID=UPI0027E0D1FB|nr:LacI family DNA-binding transcriptional regulator [Anaerocolumna sp. MB42-C2]WMJ86806.1 LacI family DNA-binding transcriptional regulator [Anaerocolumna sp. MB42-C2]
MAKQRILVQDIADSLHLSRTTVSKALNGSENISEKTRQKVLKRAAELNYRQFSTMPESFNIIKSSEQNAAPNIHGNIALTFHKFPDKQHIGSSLLTTMEQEISKYGYTLSLFTIQDTDIHYLRLPNTFDLNNIDAILCVELFDREYCKMLSSLNKPVLFIDSYYTAAEDNLNADILLMESKYRLANMVKKLLYEHRINRAGFVGSYTHCLSFYERWTGFCMALQGCDLTVNKSFCIIEKDDLKYWDRLWLISNLKMMDPLPELFVCANDSLAIQLISCLKDLNITVPKNVLVTGFDNVPASVVVEPHLTTVNSHSSDMGIIAAKKLLDRIQNPSLPYTITYLQTDAIYRESTVKKHFSNQIY